MLHVIFRAYGGENKKGRPDYYSKLLTLASVVRSLERLKPGTAELICINDGPIADDRRRLMEVSGEVIDCSNLGTRGSLRYALSLAKVRGWSSTDLVWFSEDDYLYRPDAFNQLLQGVAAHPEAAYFGLYALIGHDLPNGDVFDEPDRVPKTWHSPEPRIVDGHLWRRALSTTSTFGARVKPLAEDNALMKVAMLSGGAYDHTTCLMYQGFTPYTRPCLLKPFQHRNANKSRLHRFGVLGSQLSLNLYHAGSRVLRKDRRTLVACDPPLITHLETAFLAKGTDWSQEAQDTSQWLDAKTQVFERR